MKTAFFPVSESNIRQALSRNLIQSAPSGAVVREEMNAGVARIDLARIGDQLEGFEIKSDADILGRLPRQVIEYGLIFDRVTLVAGSVLFDEAAAVVPSWWGLVRATSNGSSLALTERRQAIQNPAQSLTALTKLLWREEAAQALSELSGVLSAKSASAGVLRSRLAKTIPMDVVKPWILKTVGNPTRLADWRRASNPFAQMPGFERLISNDRRC